MTQLPYRHWLQTLFLGRQQVIKVQRLARVVHKAAVVPASATPAVAESAGDHHPASRPTAILLLLVPTRLALVQVHRHLHQAGPALPMLAVLQLLWLQHQGRISSQTSLMRHWWH